MSKVLANEPWSYTLYEKDGDWILTLLIGGVVDVPVSIVLTSDEVAKIRQGEGHIESIVNDVRQNRSAYSAREIKPAYRGD